MRKILLPCCFQKATAALILVFVCFYGHTATAADRAPEYLQSFDPARGFKPAQRDLTEIFLQLAGSLEHHGSPVPYLRHVAAEHARVESLYRQKFGKNPASFRPAYITDDYIDGLAKNWDFLSPKLGLEPFAKNVGHTLRNAIKGTRGTGTILVEIFNRHQSRTFDQVAGKASNGGDFETLRVELIRRLELDKAVVDEAGYEVAHRDAVSFALGIHGSTMKLFKRLDQGLKPDDATRIKTYLTSVFLDVGAMAQSELQAGISEWAIGKSSTVSK